MPTQNPRLNVVLDVDLYQILYKVARRQHISLSLLARDLIKKALEREEDIYWQNTAQQREKTFSYKKALSHKEVWK